MNVRHLATERWVRYSLDTRMRAAFADLGHTIGVLAFVIAVTALKFTAYDSVLAPSFSDRWLAFVRESIALAAALVFAVPLLVAASNLAPAAGVRRYAWLAVSTPLSVLVCVTSPLPQLLARQPITSYQQQQLGALVVLLAMLFEFRARALATAGAALGREIEHVTADARVRDERLRRLQDQVAPHFLFNTLANVRRLARVDRREAAEMLRDLVRYFSVSLARGDHPRVTLADELQLVDAYLRIHQVRMGRRLTYAIDVPQQLTPALVPSMVLMTLVENAIKHGINPLVEGGFVQVSAAQSGGALRLEVADTGRGLAASEGHGVGLANIRARLSMLYGADAALLVERGHPRGFIARVVLPLATAAAP